jgi:phosphoribosylformylglycinamidine (FGAM) synthase-like enzyme
VQWFNLFLTKERYTITPRKWARNYFTFVGMAIGGAIAVGVVYIPGLNNVVFEVGPAPPIVLLAAIAGGILLFIYEIIRRFLRRKGKNIKLKTGYFGGIPKRNENLLELVRTMSGAQQNNKP